MQFIKIIIKKINNKYILKHIKLFYISLLEYKRSIFDIVSYNIKLKYQK